ncbi:uncharacterized protein LOC130697843 [Daphnia carinata]|uniref:uncharacterized protein LOC130697843 n=1 Tax=Daphnia carinata TaxID=120202 RepID=UPI0028691231|nr:uncharacterized protein LOC130697843 [Daphnia carinata]
MVYSFNCLIRFFMYLGGLRHRRRGSLDNEVRRRSHQSRRPKLSKGPRHHRRGCWHRETSLEQQDRCNGCFRLVHITTEEGNWTTRFAVGATMVVAQNCQEGSTTIEEDAGQGGSPSEPPGLSPNIVKRTLSSPKRITGQRGSPSELSGSSPNIMKYLIESF